MSETSLPSDYLERVYAGVLGKLIGVYLGRPFENWTYERIVRELGPIEYYVHKRFGAPLVVTDDDVGGTFTFIRALEDYGIKPDLSSGEIGKAWLNYIIEQRTVLWWGGNGNSTEHTAWLNLKRGVSAPASGSIALNGLAMAEQIGAQIFVDGWALVSPGRPAQAARLAGEAARVSHDGEAVHAAALWAAMEAEAFVSADIDHLIDVGLSHIPEDCLIARLVADVRAWRRRNPDWRDTRQRIEETYGYDKYPGNCHVVPNHALMVMAALYAPDDFQRAQMIVNTSGWDTDCNAGNVGCLSGILLGLDGIDAGPDWRGPLADRMLISSADGGNSINDAVRVAYRLAGLGRSLAGATAHAAPKGGAQFHFSLPGSVQGFRAVKDDDVGNVNIENVPVAGGRALALRYRGLRGTASALTPTFTQPDVVDMRTYQLMATPLVYPGQTVTTHVLADAKNDDTITVKLRLRVYSANDALRDADGEPVTLAPGEAATLRWTIPDLGGQPVAAIGIAVTPTVGSEDEAVLIDALGWDGTPDLYLRRPQEPGDFWRQAWVNGVSFFSKNYPQSFRISQDRGEGIIIHGTRQWIDYRVDGDILIHLGSYGGIAVRVQGLRRYYAALLVRGGTLRIVKVRDDETTVLAEAPFSWAFEAVYRISVTVSGDRIACSVGDVTLSARDEGDVRLADGGIGLVIAEGALSSNEIRVGGAA